MTDIALASPHCAHHGTGSYCETCKVRSLAVCAALDEGELSELDAIVHHVDIAGKSTFIHQGDEAESVFSVTEGVVRLYKLLSDGRRQIIGFAMPGDFLGLALQNRYGFSADAVDNVVLCRFDRRDFDRLVSAKPHFLKRLHEFATHELVIAQEQMTLIGRRSAEERVAAFLVAMRERWTRIRGPSVTIQLPMQRIDMADYLGLTIETVSRTLTKLARDRVILIVPDAVRILDEARLLGIARA
ncbi:cyclic nucleotide-binding domain-containing protein [Phreatobacter aquaticus]|uniref:Cyclic nucleotide-binding domain-containing protein n=1 Tax=Phreatobacter aquaticus TaxID=2570229 RepID=A0A4D7QL19_9HYPH|nr:cyclic nucleotide-binding domain-containing protein [Phreatobacter aquaticus]QCK88410.1 cyclic nucleotide-binding domain-containing protein [Phreatobacter aquaticus]